MEDFQNEIFSMTRNIWTPDPHSCL
jgi:hypothetical protein